jgi:hypothetical protein
MKKLYTLIALFVALSLNLNAQNYLMNANTKPIHKLKKGQISLISPQAKGPLSQNFEGTFPPIGWSLPTGDANWISASDTNHTIGGANSAIFDCYLIDTLFIGYLQTPECAVTAGDSIFSFWCDYYFIAGAYGNVASLFVDISTDNGATWISGTTNYLTGITLNTWVQFSIDLASYIGQNVTFRFKAISDYGSYDIAIDDVAGPALNIPAHDLGVTAITPTFVSSGTTVAPVVSVTNFGGLSEASYSVALSDGGSYNQTVPVTTAIASLANYDVTFPNWTPADGNYTLTATVTVASDTVTANNTLTAVCVVAGMLDAYTGNATALTYNGINLTTGATTGVGTFSTTVFPMAEEYDGTNIYRIFSDLTIGTVSGSGTYTQLGTMSGVAGTPTSIAYNWNTGVMYVIVLNAGNLPQLCTLNMSTYALTLVGTGATGMIIGMDFANDGFLYGPALSDTLYKINPANGVTTKIGAIGINLNYGQDVSYDVDENKLYTITCGAAYKFGYYNLTTGAFVEIADKGTDQYATFVITKIPNLSTATDILTFGFNALTPAVAGTVNLTNHTVALTVPYGTNVTALVPTITLSTGATIAPLSGIAQNFTAPFTYTVTSADASTTQTWVVTVTIAPVGINDIDANENVNIYPNPANDKLNIIADNIKSVEIYNTIGANVASYGNVNIINVADLSVGSYILKVITDKKVLTQKINITR